MGFAGGSHSFNRYAYANNNPYKYVDPNGETPVHAAAFVTGAAVAAGLEWYTNPDASNWDLVKAGVTGGLVGVASTFGVGWVDTMVIGGGANMLGEFANQMLNGKVEPYKFVDAFIIGAAGGGLGKGWAQARIKSRNFPLNTRAQSQHNMTPSHTPRMMEGSYSSAYTDGLQGMAGVRAGTAYGSAMGIADHHTGHFGGGSGTISDYVSQLPEW